MPATEASQDLASSSVQYSEAELENLTHSAQILGVPLNVLLSTPRAPESQFGVTEIESWPNQMMSGTIQNDSNIREPFPEIVDNESFHPRSELGTYQSANNAPNFGRVEVWDPGNEQNFSSEGTNGTSVNHELLGESFLLPNDEYENLLGAGLHHNHPNDNDLSEPPGFESNTSILSTCELGDLPSGLEFCCLPPRFGPNDTTIALNSHIAKATSDCGQGYSGELEQLGFPSTDNCFGDIPNNYPSDVSLDRPLASDSSSHSNDGFCTSKAPDSRPQSNSVQCEFTSSVNAVPAADDLSPHQQRPGEQELEFDVDKFPLVRLRSNLPPIAQKSRPHGPYDRNVMNSGQSQQPRRRGPFKIDLERIETGLTRTTRACIRCRMQRIRVSIREFLTK